jgi:hypothetical protein
MAGKLTQYPTLTAACLLFAVPVAIFWRPYLPFFYILDDWTALIQMVEHPFGQYLVLPDGEQWFPLCHLVMYGLVHLAGNRYELLSLINCLGTGATGFLLFLFFRRRWDSGLSLVLSLLYVGMALHHAVAWNAFYICYVLSLGFFLGALLLTDDYLRAPTLSRLLGICLCSLLSVLSHNYTLLALLALPLYALLLGGAQGLKKSLTLSAGLGAVYLVFALGYLHFAGLHAATSHNTRIFSGLPGYEYLVHLFFAAILSPSFYLFWGHYHFPVWSYFCGVALLSLSLTIIFRQGGPTEKRLAIWALLLNVLPFLLISLTRYQRSVDQAFVARYGIFTLVGVFLVLGTAWRLLAVRPVPRRWFPALSLSLLGAVILGQFLSLPLWQEKYLQISQAAIHCYRQLVSDEGAAAAIPPEEYRKFCPGAYPTISRTQALAIQRLLAGSPLAP